MRKITTKKPSVKFESLMSDSHEKGRSSIIMDNNVGEYFFLKIERIVPYNKQARKNFDKESIKELALTIKEYGIRQPLTVIKSQKQGEYQVISGERRLRAAEYIGLEKVPCIILTDNVHAEEIALIENTQRQDLHPLELGEAYKSLLNISDRGDLTKLANKLGKPKSTISEYVSYTDLPEVIKEYVISNNIKQRIILRQILKCKTIEEMKTLLGMVDGKEIKKYKKLNLINVSLENQNIRISVINRKITNSQRSDLIIQLEKLLYKYKEDFK